MFVLMTSRNKTMYFLLQHQEGPRQEINQEVVYRSPPWMVGSWMSSIASGVGRRETRLHRRAANVHAEE